MLDLDNPLDARLLDFAHLMRQKFLDRADKQRARGNKSVTDADYDWTTLSAFSPSITAHAREEIYEWESAASKEERAKECVDVANMMFLDWMSIFETRRSKGGGGK